MWNYAFDITLLKDLKRLDEAIQICVVSLRILAEWEAWVNCEIRWNWNVSATVRWSREGRRGRRG
jgi:hypothetical protein